MICLYAVTEVAPQGFRGLGLESQPVVSLEFEGLHLAHSSHRDDFELDVTPEALWAYEAVVDELLDLGAVLPFRFGTTLPDRAAAEALLQKDGGQFRQRLAELRGRVELAVRVALPPEETGAPPDDGAGYLAVRARAERAREQLLAPLESAAVASAKREAGAPSVVSASYLVRRDEVDQFASLVRDLQERNPELALSCTGPWAPYSFAGEPA
jgi:hypothetical protein